MNKTFKVAQVRDLLNQLNNEEITISRFVEILNEQAEGQSSSKIKQLEWGKSGRLWRAETQFGAVYMEEDHRLNEIRFRVYADFHDWFYYKTTLDEAKDTAQRDFEKRIKECLE